MAQRLIAQTLYSLQIMYLLSSMASKPSISLLVLLHISKVLSAVQL